MKNLKLLWVFICQFQCNNLKLFEYTFVLLALEYFFRRNVSQLYYRESLTTRQAEAHLTHEDDDA